MGRDRPGRVDWHKVFEDFAYLEMTGTALAERSGLSVALLQRVATGRLKPAPLAADRLMFLWCDLMSKSAEFLPRCTSAEGLLKPEVAGIDCDEPVGITYQQLQQITAEWARQERGR